MSEQETGASEIDASALRNVAGEAILDGCGGVQDSCEDDVVVCCGDPYISMTNANGRKKYATVSVIST